MVFALRLGVLISVCSWAFTARGTNWYVDNAASGNNNGTSWANAWTSFGNVSWGNVAPGDTVYISGGTSSQTYFETLEVGSAGSAGLPITISVGQDAGHNGKVIIDGQNTRSKGIALNDYIYLTGKVGSGANFVLQNYVLPGGDRDTTGGAGLWGGSSCVIEYVEVNHSMNGIYCSVLTDVEIRYCYLHDIEGDYGIRVNGYAGTNFLNYHVHHNVLLTNGDMSGSSGGPDGVQCQDGLTMHDNVLRCVSGPVTAGQHPDGVQAMGCYHKIYNNYFANYLNSCVKPGPIYGLGYTVWEQCYIYNNIFCVDTTPYPNNLERGIEMGPDSTTVNIVRNLYVQNNTFVDINYLGITGASFGATTVSNVLVENNIFYNVGRNAGSKTVFTWDNNQIATGVTFDYNLVNPGVDGGTTLTFNGAPLVQAHPRANAPSFVSYVTRSGNNNFHLKTNDVGAVHLGINLSAFFSTDKDGTPRTTPWSLGAYDPASTVGGTSLLVNPSYVDFGFVNIGSNADYSLTIQNVSTNAVTGSASTLAPFSILAGGSYNLGTGQTQVVTVRFSPATLGLSMQPITFTGGSGASGTVAGTGTPSSYTVLATTGAISPPFVITNSGGYSYIYQPIETTTETNGGLAVYSVTITNIGSYIIQALVNAPGDPNNSFFVNIDAEPQDPTMIWDIPLTTGFETRLVSWRGNGTDTNNQFMPKRFALNAGSHQVIIRGREANVQLQSFALKLTPPPPQNLRIVSGP